jgi:hypothetical protein
MQYFNLHVPMLRMPEFVGETPANRGVWISLMGYCCDLENSGRIAGSLRWKSRMWEQSCGVTLEELGQDSALWEWDGDDLLVWGFPHRIQASLQAQRDGGKKGGRPRKNPPDNPIENPPDNAVENPPDNPVENPPENRKEREGKGKEGKEKETLRESETAAPLSLADAQAYAQRWTASSAAGLTYDPAMVQLWFADRERKSWQASSGQFIGPGQAHKDLEYWLLRNKTGSVPGGNHVASAQLPAAKEKGGARPTAGLLVNPDLPEPCYNWRQWVAEGYPSLEAEKVVWGLLPADARLWIEKQQLQASQQ